MGNTYCVILVIVVTAFLFRELLGLKRDTEKENDHKIPRFYLLSWYFFGLTLFFLIPRFLPDETEVTTFSEPTLQFIHQKSPLTLFVCFVAGILIFTLSLEKGIMRYQFKMLAWTFVLLMFVVTQVCAMVYNIYTGLFWFIFPCTCVITNDCFAYVWGMLLGRTPLIKLSPKKTVEGFIGGALTTMFWAFISAGWLQSQPFFACP